ncbi:MAG: hypothetical protein H0Z24_09935 [Thermosipho sp. (in: Bacteria)]|nr:hypothetical protein [Thermosipho sp. (in: thermotogales)]
MADPDVDGRMLEKHKRILNWLNDLTEQDNNTAKKLHEELKWVEGYLILSSDN